MSRAASYSTVSGQPRTFAIAGSLLLVSVSYVLLLSAPVITRHLRSVVSGVGGVKTFEWLPLACGAGLVLGGASALVFVLTQIAREAERRPYVCLAPVLAAFAACILIGLRADLPLKGVASEQVAVFGLALSVIGGSLVQTSRVASQMMGLGFTFLPPLSLFIVLWTLSGKMDPAKVIWSLSAPARAFLGMLTLSSFAIAAVATLGRRAEPAPSARLPREADSYVLYELEDDFMADEARMRQRGLPGWAIVLAAAAAVALGFMALKVFLERRAALNFLAPTTNTSAPANAAPGLSPLARPGARFDSPRAPSDAPLGAPELQPAAPKEPAPSQEAPAVAPAEGDAPQGDSEPTKAVPEQPLREQLAPQPSAPEAAHKAAAVSSAKLVREPVKAGQRKVSRSARVEARRSAHEQDSEKLTPARVERAAARAGKAAPPAAEPVPSEKSVAKAVVEQKPEAKKPAKPQNVADLALQAAALATDNRASKKPGQEAKPPADDSLDALMDNVLKPEKGGKKQKANDDPIYGL
jgi:hypothetical protein